MTGKVKLYIGLLILGLALVGAGFWFLFNPSPVVEIPDSEPVIAMQLDFVMRGEFDNLYLYDDGTVIYVEEKNLRMPTPENPPTRVWNKGQIQPEDLNNLIDFFKNSKFDEFEAYYQYPDPSGGSGVVSDMYCTISIISGNFSNTVKTFGYLTPDGGLTYPDMPYPLNEIYRQLKGVIENNVQEVYREINPPQNLRFCGDPSPQAGY